MTDTLEDLDGQLVVAARYRYSDQPIVIVNYWPTGIRTADFLRDYGYTLPMEVRDNGGAQGSYSIGQRLYGHALTVRLIDGGKTQAIKQEQVPVPPPKVRAGIETRYRRGQWEKYLKSKGWVAP